MNNTNSSMATFKNDESIEINIFQSSNNIDLSKLNFEPFVILLNKDDKLSNIADLVFYANMWHNTGCIQIDNTKTMRFQKKLLINLSIIPKNINKILIGNSICSTRYFDFSNIETNVQVMSKEKSYYFIINEEKEKFNQKNTILILKLERNSNDEWVIFQIKQGIQIDSIYLYSKNYLY